MGDATMAQRCGPLRLLLPFIVVAAVSAGTAYLVAGNTHDAQGSGVDVTEPQLPVALSQRATVSLAEATIVPVVSAAGMVVEIDGAWYLEAQAAPADLAYRLLDPPVGVKALIDGGPVGFACPWQGLSPNGGEVSVAGARDFNPTVSGVVMRCQIPTDEVRVIAGMTGTMVLQLGEPVTASSLPVAAVVGAAGAGQVIVVGDDGTTEIRSVQLGASDVYNIEITGGLEPDERVLAVPTQYDFNQELGAP